MQYFARSTKYRESDLKADTESSTGQSSCDLPGEGRISERDRRDDTRQQTEDGEKDRPKADDTEEKGYVVTSSEPNKIPKDAEADASHTRPATNTKRKR